MSTNGFCTACGTGLTPDVRFCTSCGSPVGGVAAPAPRTTSGPAAASSQASPATAIALGALLLVLGSVAAFFSLRASTDVPRAVSGVPGGGAPGAGAPAAEGGLPSGHPSIELPAEVVEFLDGLAAEAAKDPTNVEAAQKLARARYRASVINASYRASAEQALAKLQEIDPGNVEGLRISANLAYDGGDFSEAQKRFEIYLAKNPDDVSALTDLGSTLLFQEKLDEAVASYQKALAKDPKFMQALFNMGIVQHRQGKKDEAIVSFKQALDAATHPAEKQQVENALAETEGREPMQIAGAGPAATAPGGVTAPAGVAQAPAAQGAAQGGMPMPPPAPERDVPSNAGTDFQREAQKPLITHPIVGPRVIAFEWTGPSSGRVKIADFPMEQMPPFARIKFKSGMAEKLTAIAKQEGITDAVTVELVDNASGRVMDTLDSSADSAPTPGSK